MKRLFLALSALLALCALTSASAQPAGIAGCQQPASVLYICDTFDYPDGTLIDGQTTPDGHSTWTEGLHAAVVQKGVLTNTGNSYGGFYYSATPGGTPQPLKSFGGVFRYNSYTGAVSTVLIASQGSALTKMLHLELGLRGWTLSVADSPSYPFPYYISSDFYKHPLTIGVLYRASMDIDAVNCKMTIHLPDGDTKAFTHPSVCDVAPTFTHYQLGAATPAGTASWAMVWAGPSKAEAFAAAGGATNSLDFAKMFSTSNVEINEKAGSTTGTVDLMAFTTPSLQSGNLLNVTIVAKVEGGSPGVADAIRVYHIPIRSDGAVSQKGAVTQENYDTGCCGVTLDITPTFAFNSPGVLTISATPTVGGAAGGSISNIRYSIKCEALGDHGGVWTPL